MGKFDPKDPKTWNADFNELDESDLEKLREVAEPLWRREPGWEEPMHLGTRVEALQRKEDPSGEAKGPGDSALIHYITDKVDFVRLECTFMAGTHGQLITRDDHPQVYELRAPETVLLLPTKPQVFESPFRLACTWIIRLPAGTVVRPEVAGWHQDLEKLKR